MIDLLKKFFHADKDISRNSSEIDSAHDIRIATCAIFLEMANIDGEFSESERQDIVNIFKDKYNLSDELIDELFRTSKQELEGSIDLWQFTNLINQNYSLEEKIGIIETIWRIAYTDGYLDQHEDYLVHKLANLLRLNHKQLIGAKLKVLKNGHV